MEVCMKEKVSEKEKRSVKQSTYKEIKIKFREMKRNMKTDGNYHFFFLESNESKVHKKVKLKWHVN